MALPETLTREECCALLGVTIGHLDQTVAQHFGDFRRDGTMSLKTARSIADQMAIARLRETLDSKFNPRQHTGHDVTISATLGPYCRECRHPLFKWPLSVAVALDANSHDDEVCERAETLLAEIRAAYAEELADAQQAPAA